MAEFAYLWKAAFILIFLFQKIFLPEISFVCVLFTLFIGWLYILHFKVYMDKSNLSIFIWIYPIEGVILWIT